MGDPVAAVRRLYRSFGDTVSELHARRMEAFLDQRPKDVFGHHRYDPADFGWTYSGLADEFADYTSRYRVAPEAHSEPDGHLGRHLPGSYHSGMSERSRNLPRRSCMSSPGSNERFLAKAPTVPADMSFLDLEDSVAPLEKKAARAKVADAIKNLPWDDRVLCVRSTPGIPSGPTAT